MLEENNDSGPEINKITPDNDVDKSLYNTWSKLLKPEWIEVGELKTSFPVMHKKVAGKIENFQVREDDIFITSHPRSGTTIMQEMIWLIVNDFDFKRAKSKIYTRVSYLEMESVYPACVWHDMVKTKPYLDCFEDSSNNSSQRIYKSHNPFNLLPRQIRDNEVQPKIIHIVRDPKDVCVAYFEYSVKIGDFYGTFEEFSIQFMAGRVCYGPYWGQVFSYWNERHRSNIMIIRYEEIHTNMPGVVKNIAEFLEKDVTEEKIKLTVKHIEYCRDGKNKYFHYEDLLVNIKMNGDTKPRYKKLMGRMEVDEHKKLMSVEMIKKFNAWTEENVKDSGLEFKTEKKEKSSCNLM